MVNSMSSRQKRTDEQALYWYEAPADPTALPWKRHTIGTGFSELDSLSVEDLNADGHPDVVIGEIFNPKRVIVYENINCGQSWKAHEVDRGKESHNGAIAVDLNGDGKKDIVSIAYFVVKDMHIWRNDGE